MKLFWRWLYNFFAFLEDRVDGLSWASIQTQSTGLHATRRVKLERWSREPCPGRADRNTDGTMGAAIWVTNEVISGYHHGLYSFKQTLGKEFKHIHKRAPVIKMSVPNSHLSRKSIASECQGFGCTVSLANPIHVMLTTLQNKQPYESQVCTNVRIWSFNSGICSRLLLIAPIIFSIRAFRPAS